MASVPKGGRIHLVQAGVQDQFFTGSPQITYFKTLHDSGSTYVLQNFNNVPDSPLRFGDTGTIRLNNIGDLIRKCFLSVELSSITTTSNLYSNITDLFTTSVSTTYSDYNVLNWYDNSSGYSPWFYFGAFVDETITGRANLDNIFKTWNQKLNLKAPDHDPLGRYMALGAPVGSFSIVNVDKIYFPYRKQMSFDVRSTRDTMCTAYFPQNSITSLLNTIDFQLDNNSTRDIYVMLNLEYDETKFAIYKLDSKNTAGWSYNVTYVTGSVTTIDSMIFDDGTVDQIAKEGVAWEAQYPKQIKFRFLFTDPVIYYRIGYTDSIGTAMIDHVDLRIGGQTIERLNGELIHIYNSFWKDSSSYDALKWLTGTTGKKTGMGVAVTDYTRPGVPSSYPLYINTSLPFYFTQESSLAIPVSSILYQPIEVQVKLRKFSELFVSVFDVPDYIKNTLDGNVLTSLLPTEYIVLSNSLSNFIKTQRTFYLATQYQLYEDEILNNDSEIAFDVNFINPVKEMFIVVQKQEVIDDNDYYKYCGFNSIGLTYNESTRFEKSVMTIDYLRSLSAKLHTRCTTNNAISYSFSLYPENPYPTGQVNMSRIQNKRINMNVQGEDVLKKIRIYAKSYNILNVYNGIAGMLFIDNNSSI